MSSNDDLRRAAQRRVSSPRGPKRSSVLAIAATAWVAVVVAAAGSDADDSLLGIENLDVVWIIVLSVAVLFSIIFFLYLKPFSGEWTPPEKTRGIGLWFAAACLLGLLVWRPTLFSDLISEQEDALPTQFEEAAPEVPVDQPAVETVAEATDILLLMVAVAVVLGVWFLAKRRASSPPEVDAHRATALETDMAQALELAAGELDGLSDPRASVVRSYAVLERVLAVHGLARSRAETPTEHLGRALQNLRIDATPVMQLGALYEIARFSEHHISEADQREAAHALRQAQDSLASLS